MRILILSERRETKDENTFLFDKEEGDESSWSLLLAFLSIPQIGKKRGERKGKTSLPVQEDEQGTQVASTTVGEKRESSHGGIFRPRNRSL